MCLRTRHTIRTAWYTFVDATKIKKIDVHKKLSCKALKSKQDCLGRCKELDLNTQVSLTTLKGRLHFEEKVAEYQTKDFQRDTVNIFGNSKFTSTCLVDKDLIYATTNNEIYQLYPQRDGLGIYAETSLVTKAPSEGLPSTCHLENHIFLVILVILEF